MHVLEHSGGQRKAEYQEREPSDHIGRATAGDVEHRQQDGREQQRRAQILLQPEQEQRHADHHANRRQVWQRQQLHTADPAASCGQQLSILFEIGRQEHHQQELDELHRLNTNGPDDEPQRGAAPIGVLAQHQGQDLQEDRQHRPGVAVAAQPADRRQQADEGHCTQPDQDPDALARAEAWFQS